MRFGLLVVGAFLSLQCIAASGQWEMQDSRVTVDLRGIHYVGGGVAWASGSHGTVLRTVNMGSVWQLCATPPDANDLDFRGVQAFDKDTAIVMSSGPGDKSRLYKTADGCETWTLVFTNPDKDGFWDAIAASRNEGLLVGDPVNGRFPLFTSSQTGLNTWTRYTSSYLTPVFDHLPLPSETLFAASNSAMRGSPSTGVFFVTGGERFALFHVTTFRVFGQDLRPTTISWTSALPLAKSKSAGAFSFDSDRNADLQQCRFVVVGGDYALPEATVGTAAYSKGGEKWKAASSPPHGYRSAVAYSTISKAWITVGPNGTDVSTDDGRNWRALKPGQDDAADADKNWNALSLPFVVGPKGRIGILRESVLAGPAKKP